MKKQQADDLKGLAAREAGNNISKVPNARATTGPKAPKWQKKVEQFLGLLEEGHSIEAASVGAGLVRKTVYEWMSKHEEFKAEVEDARHAAEGSIMAELRGAATRKDDTRALMWLLSKLRPDLYGDKQALEVTTKKEDGVPEVIAMLQQTQHLVVKDSADSADPTPAD
jgi:hypothetical protein